MLQLGSAAPLRGDPREGMPLVLEAKTIFGELSSMRRSSRHAGVSETPSNWALPDSLIDAARIDGAGHLRTFFNIALPLAWPAILSVAVFTFREP
jgi:Binding-protein-dependent transport system inner membrane component